MPSQCYAAGVDVGSAAAKCVILDTGTGLPVSEAVLPTGRDVAGAGKSVLEAACSNAGITRDAVRRIVGTGYGRVSLPFADRTLTEITCHADKEAEISLLNELASEVGNRARDAAAVRVHAPRVLLTGTPVGMGAHKVIKLIEDCGGSVVCLDNCSVHKKTRVRVDRNKDPLTALAEAYLNVPCAVMSPNPLRYEALRTLAADFSADCVVDLAWQGCQTYAIEAFAVRRFIQKELGLPCLDIETDYSASDTEQLKVRIEAFLEMVS